MTFIDEIQHPETGELIPLAAESAEQLEQQIADMLLDVDLG